MINFKFLTLTTEIVFQYDFNVSVNVDFRK